MLQSPRNMYQCQMGKQTMGTPALAMKQRADNKLYRIGHPQAPLVSDSLRGSSTPSFAFTQHFRNLFDNQVQTRAHREYAMDEYPQGTNAVVSVMSTYYQ